MGACAAKEGAQPADSASRTRVSSAASEPAPSSAVPGAPAASEAGAAQPAAAANDASAARALGVSVCPGACRAAALFAAR